jgi:hypothetical protein
MAVPRHTDQVLVGVFLELISKTPGLSESEA